MNLAPSDLLVGGVAVVIGVIFLYCSLSDHAGFFRLRKIRWLEARLGRAAARWICVALAAALIAFGGAIAMGFNLQRYLATESANLGPRSAGHRLVPGSRAR